MSQKLTTAQIPWAIFAGAAVSLYSDEADFSDIDILIRAEDGQVVAALFPEADKSIDAVGAVRCVELPFIEIIAGLSHYCSLSMDQAMIDRLTQKTLSNVPVSVVSLEDNIAIKAMFGRGPEVGKRDWEHVELMLSHAEKLDWNYLTWRLQDCVPDRADLLIQRLHTLWEKLKE